MTASSKPDRIPEATAPARRARRLAGSGSFEPNQAVDRRELILAAATRRFADDGFNATTVRQIADDVHILSGSLYHHFDTKEAMLDEIVRGPVLEQRQRTLAIAAMPHDAETRLVTLISAELEALTRDQQAFAIVYHERKFFRRSADFAYLMAARKEAYDAWARVLAEGMTAGQFAAGTDIYLTISTVLRMLNTGADWYRNEDGHSRDVVRDYPLGQLLDFYLAFVLQAVRAPARTGEPLPQPVVPA